MIITAAGSSTRMRPAPDIPDTLDVPNVPDAPVGALAGGPLGAPVKKEYLPLGPGLRDGEGRPLTVLGAAVSAFAGFDEIDLIVITVPADGEAAARAALPRQLPGSSGGPAVLFTG
ncbi:MAG: hypothetical protein LBL56_07700, partial [Treponema sp.]|nr:hypothetical protein [Treponema sp.]